MPRLTRAELKVLLDDRVDRYNKAEFIDMDPVSIPHKYSLRQDIEITAFWTAMLAWGQRVTIINKSNELFGLMDGAPHDFIINHEEKDRARFENFKHRTFNYTDTLYFLEFLQQHYQQHDSLEDAFLVDGRCNSLRESLTYFEEYFFSLPDAPHRTRKHIASPARKSTCKRLCMYLRWMIRNDEKGVDFGLWKKIGTHQLMMPLDVHVDRVARSLGLLKRKQNDWETVEELTKNLRKFDKEDPVKYDFALFGMGVEGE